MTLNKPIVKSFAMHSGREVINDGLKSFCSSFQGSESASRFVKDFSTPRSLNLLHPFAVLEATKPEGFLPVFSTLVIGPVMSRFFIST